MKAFTLGFVVGRRFKNNEEIFEQIGKGMAEKETAPAQAQNSGLNLDAHLPKFPVDFVCGFGRR